MSTYTPTPDEPTVLTIWDTDTIALGGVNGPMNVPLKTLADNIAWLKAAVETLQANLLTVVPVGTVIAVPYTTVPDGYLYADGSGILRATYSALADLLYCGDDDNPTADWGYRCTNANGTGRSTSGAYIVLPDLRGQFVRGLDDDAGIDVDRSLWDLQLGSIASHTHEYQVATSPTTPGGNAAAGGTSSNTSEGSIHTLATGDTETRPTNLALMFCIKY